MVKIKYNGKEERRVILKNKDFIIHKGSVFEVTKIQALKFKDKPDFKEVKK